MQKMIGRERPLLPEILDQSDRVGAKCPIFDLQVGSKSKLLTQYNSLLFLSHPVFSLVVTQP